mgnify:FL=1
MKKTDDKSKSTILHEKVEDLLKKVINSKWLIISFAIIVPIVIIVIGFIYFRSQVDLVRERKNTEFAAISKLKIDQLVQWQKERNGDVMSVSRSPLLTSAVERFLVNKNNNKLKETISKHLSIPQKEFGYEDIHLTTIKGEIIVSAGLQTDHFDSTTYKKIVEAVTSQSITWTNLYYSNDDNKLNFDIIAPIVNEKDTTIAVLVFRIDPNEYLYPLIQSLPTPSRTSETVLVRKEGDSVVVLNELRHRQHTALRLKIPLTAKELPAVQSVLGYTGLWDGQDYRGVDVVAFIQKVPVLDWFMVTKIDKGELYADLYREGKFIIIRFSLILLLVIAGLAFIYSYRQRNIYKELWNASAEHSTTLQSIGDAVISTDKLGRIQFMNTVAEQLTGWGVSEAKGKNLLEVFEIINEETRLPIKSAVEKVIQAKKPIGLSNHTILISKDGREFSITECASPIKNKEGEIIGIVLAFKDQTEEMEAQRKIITSEERFRQIAENSQEWIWEVDSNGLYTYSNEIVEHLLGYHPEEIIGKKYLYDFFLPSEREELKNVAFEVFKQRQPFRDYINRITTKNGGTVVVSTSAVPVLDDHGSLLGYRGADVNITDRLQVEEARKLEEVRLQTQLELRNMIDASQDILFDYMLEALTKSIQSQFAFIGTLDEGEAVMTIHKWSTNAMEKCAIQNKQIQFLISEAGLWGECVRRREPIIVNSYANAQDKKGTPDGHVPIERFMAVPIFDGGKIVAVAVVANKACDYTESDTTALIRLTNMLWDILRRKWKEEELIEAKEHAEESDRLKSAFLCNISHEIRTPMNGILGFAQLLREPDLTGEEQQQYLGIMEKSGARMLNIITAIVSISKIESGQMEISISDTNVNEQIEFVYNFFKPDVEQNGMQLITKKALPLKEAIIKSDREKIYSILISLVSNATKFTHSGSIEFGYKKKDKFLEFFVKDTGIGIADEKKGIIFERFRQGSESMTRNYEGAGLGLSIAKAYVEMLGGKIWVESELGKGSTFYFTIPYNAEAEKKAIPKEPVLAGDKDDIIKNLKILIVEDDEASELFLSTALKMPEEAVFIAINGIEAVEICRNNPDIDLVLMDMRMPEMDGYEATQQIREFNKDVIIIAQTAFGLSGDRQKAMDAGCTDYISKPVDITLLKALIRKHSKKQA